MALRKKVRIGDLLVQGGIITEDQLMTALADQKKTGRKLGKALTGLGYVSEDNLLEFLSRQLQMPLVDLRTYSLKEESVQLLPETLARRFRAIVLDDSRDEILVGLSDPTDIYAVDEIEAILKRPIRPAVVREADLIASIDNSYRKTSEISSLAEELHDELTEEEFDVSQLGNNDDVSDAPVVKLLQHLFEDAVQMNASDIHIEPDEHVLRIRQRVDGVLQEQEMKETRIAPALVVRLKLLAGLDISEKRVPQDGRFNIKVKDKSIDIRVSTLPIQNGESVVMRLLDQSGGSLNLDDLGIPDAILNTLRKHIVSPHGMVLVTGPTGSGKTTTLYSILSELNKPEKKIITAEDPVEYRLPRINQVQINNKVGLTFAKTLRSALRQDPDIVLIGEMRDQETAQIGLRAAMTGHFVLSTLHTNDAVSTANRLIDMGCEGYLVGAAVKAIVAQRLVRRLCDSCAQAYEPDTQETSWLKAILGKLADTISFKTGGGCPQCNNTGYKGRIGVYELLEINSQMADALRASDAVAFTHAANECSNFRPLVYSALDYAAAGVTSLEEVFRVAGELVEDTNNNELDFEVDESWVVSE